MNRPNGVEAPRVAIVTDLIKNNKGRFVTTTFVKTNGQVRTINGRFGVHKGTTGKGMTHDPARYGHYVIAEMVPDRDSKGRFTKAIPQDGCTKAIGNDRRTGTQYQYRTINLTTLQSATFNGKTLIAEENTIY